MKKMDIVLLLTSNLFFIAVAVFAFHMSGIILQGAKDDGEQQKFKAFVDNVESGKWQLTTDRWLEGMRRERAIALAYRTANAGTARVYQDYIWVSLTGILFQTVAVFTVWRRLRKRVPDTSRNPTLTTAL